MLWWIDYWACCAVRALGACACRLPVTWALWWGRRAGDLMYVLKPRRVRISDVNLQWAFGQHVTPAQRRAIVREAFRTLGQSAVELLRLPQIDRAYVERYVTVQGREHLDAALARGRGIIFLTGHFGNWELSSIVGGITGYPMVVLAREQKLPRCYRLLVSYREAKGCRVIGKGMALRAMVRELRANHIIGIVGDQGAKTQGSRVTFFGRDALTPVGPVALAVRTGATVLPTFIRRVQGPYHCIEIEPPIDLTSRAHETSDAVVSRGLQAFMDRLEAHVRRTPGQWLWMHRRWKSTLLRHAIVLNDGKAGHVKQSLAVVDALRTRHPALTHEVIDIAYRSPVRRILAALSTWIPGWPARRLLPALVVARNDLLHHPCDFVISCGASQAPVNLLLARAHEAKSIVIMRPPLVPLRAFDLALIPSHDSPPRRVNVVPTLGALAACLPERLADAQRALLVRAGATLHNGERIGLLVGGDSADVRWPPQQIAQALDHLAQWCVARNTQLLATTSRRTSAAVERACAAHLQGQSWCPVLIIANNGNIEGAVEGILGASQVVIVTGESTSMVSEAVASGRRVVVLLPDGQGLRSMRSKRRALLDAFQVRGLVRLATAATLVAAIEEARAAPVCAETNQWQRLCEAVRAL